MKSILFLAAILLVSICFAACSGGASPDGNIVQVENGGVETAPRLEIPSEYASAADALTDGNRLFDAGETEKAIEVLLQAVKLDPDLAEAFFKLGIAYALVEADQDAAVEPVDEPAPESGSRKAPEKKKNSIKAFESAVDAYKKALSQNKDDDNAHYHLGLTYNKLNQDESAARSLREAVKLKPDNTEYQTGLGIILIKLAKYGEAVQVLKKALELDPNNIDAEELLERAEAGRKRIEFSPPKKEDKQSNSSESNTNAASPDRTDDVPGNKAVRPSVSTPRSTPAPAKTPR